MRLYWYPLLLALASPASAALVKGTVIGPDDKPVAGAQIRAEAFSSNKSVLLKSDSQGKFSVDLEQKDTNPRAAVGRALVYAPPLAVGGGTLKVGDNVIRLEKGSTLQGSVTDPQGKPVEGAWVRLRLIYSNDYSTMLFLQPPLTAPFTVQTKKDGSWTITGAPTSLKAEIELDDPHYVRADAQVAHTGDPTIAPALVARPAAIITGRVVYDDGKPAPGVKVFAQGQGIFEAHAEGVTGADGSYRLGSLAAGVVNVMVDAPSDKWVAAAQEGVNTKEGETTKAGDLVFTSGALVEGTVTDATDGKPLANTSIGSYGPQRPRSSGAIIGTETDAQGHFHLRVAPGASYLYVSGAPEGYIRLEKGVDLTLNKGETRTVPFQLSRELTISGTALDPRGNPAVGAKIFAVKPDQPPDPGFGGGLVDKNGKFTLHGLEAGSVDLRASGDWQLVAPDRLTIPYLFPVKATLYRINHAPFSGRVVTPAGVPVPGAAVKVQVYTPAGGGFLTGSTEQLTTDAQGHFALPRVRTDATAELAVTKPGYAFVSGGKVTKGDDSFTISDSVLAPLSAKLEGKVVDANGKAVEGAVVLAPEAGPAARTVTGKDGHFLLENLPDRNLYVVAVHSSGTASLQFHTNIAPPTIPLSTWASVAPGQDLQRAYTLLEQLAKDPATAHYYGRELIPAVFVPYDPDRALKLGAGLDAKSQDRMLTSLLEALAQANPQRVADWAPEHLEQIKDNDQYLQAAVKLGLAIAPLKPALAATIYHNAMQRLTADRKVQNWYEWANLAALAARLKNGEAESLLEKATVALKQGGGREDAMEAVAEALAEGDTDLALKVAEGLPLQHKISALVRAAIAASPYDAAGARRMLDELLKLVSPSDQSGYRFGEAAEWVIPALGKTDPAAALAVAREVKDDLHKAMALALAARFQKEGAAALFREAIHDVPSYAIAPGQMARIAAMAYELDPTLGKELFQQANERLSVHTRLAADENPDSRLPAEVAFYYSRVNPAESQVLLEKALAEQLQRPGEGGSEIADIAAAMAAIDPARAIQIARSIPDNPDRVLDAERKIAEYLVAPATARRAADFGRWIQGSSLSTGLPVEF